MKESKLIQSILALNNEEIRCLKRWILSNFVNKNEDISKLYKFIETRRAITERTVTKEKLHDYLYPNTAYNDLRIRHLIWQATDIVEDFIVYYRVQQKKMRKNYC